MQRFAEKLIALRERHGMTQRKLARAIGVNHTYINRVEKGERKPNAEFLLKISEAFGVSTDVLMKDTLDLPEEQ